MSNTLLWTDLLIWYLIVRTHLDLSVVHAQYFRTDLVQLLALPWFREEITSHFIISWSTLNVDLFDSTRSLTKKYRILIWRDWFPPRPPPLMFLLPRLPLPLVLLFVLPDAPVMSEITLEPLLVPVFVAVGGTTA